MQRSHDKKSTLIMSLAFMAFAGLLLFAVSGCEEDRDPGAIVLNEPEDTTPNSVTLSWSQSDFEDFYSYRLYYSTTPNFDRLTTDFVEVFDQTITRTTVTELTEELTYHFRIYVEDSDGYLSPPSNEVFATTTFRPFSVDLNKPVRASATSISVSWTPSDLVERFKAYAVCWSTVESFDFDTSSCELIYAIDSTETVIDSLETNTVYFFKVYVIDNGDFVSDGSNMQSEATWTWTQSGDLAVNDNPSCMAMGRNGSKAWIVHSNPSRITEIDPVEKTVIGTYPLDIEAPFGAVVNHTMNRIYICDQASHEVIAFSTTSHTITNRIAVGQGPAYMVMHPDADTLYVASVLDSGLTRIDLDKYDTDFFSLGRTPGGIDINPAGTIIYFSGTLDGKIHAFSLTTWQLVHSYDVGLNPQGVTLAYEGDYLFVANYYDGTVSVLATYDQQIVATIPVGDGPSNITYSHDDRHVYVTLTGSNKLAVLSPVSYGVLELVPLDETPYGLTIAPLSSDIWICQQDAGNVVCIQRNPM